MSVARIHPCPGSDASRSSSGAQAFVGAVDARLDDLLAEECRQWCAVDPALERGFDLLRGFIANGGKRLRPSFAYWGFVGAGGDPDDRAIVELGAALEMLHTFALLHDDVMDGSAMRRHMPSVHCALTTEHERRGWRGESRRFGEGMAVLLGDLALVYADHLSSSLPWAVRSCLHRMKVELHVGQYLDLLNAAEGGATVDRVTNVVRYKTTKYSVERPLHLGLALALASASPATTHRGLPVAERLSSYGYAVGEAFQLRDDLLGAFGDPLVTGKPIGDDFRDGKQTLLVVLARTALTAAALADGSEHERALLDRLGADDLTAAEIHQLRVLIEASGARDRLEQRIAELTRAAHEILPSIGLTPDAEAALASLADHAAWRTA